MTKIRSLSAHNKEDREMKQNHLLSVRNVTVMAMFGALAAVLMIFEVPLPFIAPSFYGMDISEVPVLVGTFALGPVAGVVMELVKILTLSSNTSIMGISWGTASLK